MNPYCTETNSKNLAKSLNQEFLVFDASFESGNVDLVIKVNIIDHLLLLE